MGLKSNALPTIWYCVPFTLRSNFTCCTKLISVLELCPWSLRKIEQIICQYVRKQCTSITKDLIIEQQMVASSTLGFGNVRKF
jgi:hypothetical protein